MFHLKKAALFFIQLLNMWSVFAGPNLVESRDISVSTGDSVKLACNISNETTTMIQWTKDRFHFVYSTPSNRTFSNFSSPRLRIETNIHSMLNVLTAQRDDERLYTCTLTGDKGLEKITWTLTVLENQKRISLRYIKFTLPFAFGLLLCCTALAFCLCRKRGTRKRNNQRVQSQSQSEEQKDAEICDHLSKELSHVNV